MSRKSKKKRQRQFFRHLEANSKSGDKQDQPSFLGSGHSADRPLTIRPNADVTPVVIDYSSQVFSYNECLLENARTQWQFGDWESLVKISSDILQNHPDRAKLALLAAAGHLQQGNTSHARQYLRLARDWGCSKKLMSQILIAGVHNTLGRAALVSGQETRALRHFEAAITTGTPGNGMRLITQARVDRELAQLKLPTCRHTVSLPTSRSAAVAEQVPIHDGELYAMAKHEAAEIQQLKRDLQNSIRKEILNATQQLEAFLDVQSYLQSGQFSGEMHGWPISPDLARYLIDLLEANDYDLVIEFGSGTSTVLMARTLAKLASRRQAKPPAKQVAFEHLNEFHTKTLAHLRQAGLIGEVQLVLAPLQTYTLPNGNTYLYYDCFETLAELSKTIGSTDYRILVLVDGPPGATCKHARYPALSVILANFKGPLIDIVMDDYLREDEKQIVQLWMKDIQEAQLRVMGEELQLEKGGYIMRIQA